MQRLTTWEELGLELDPNGYVPCQDNSVASDGEEPPRVRARRVYVSGDEAAAIELWRQNVPLRDIEYDVTSQSVSKTTSGGEQELSELDDSVSVLENRSHERVRKQQWLNMQRDKYARFGVDKARVSTALQALTGRKRHWQDGDNHLSSSSKKSKATSSSAGHLDLM